MFIVFYSISIRSIIEDICSLVEFQHLFYQLVLSILPYKFEIKSDKSLCKFMSVFMYSKRIGQGGFNFLFPVHVTSKHVRRWFADEAEPEASHLDLL